MARPCNVSVAADGKKFDPPYSSPPMPTGKPQTKPSGTLFDKNETMTQNLVRNAHVVHKMCSCHSCTQHMYSTLLAGIANCNLPIRNRTGRHHGSVTGQNTIIIAIHPCIISGMTAFQCPGRFPGAKACVFLTLWSTWFHVDRGGFCCRCCCGAVSFHLGNTWKGDQW